MTRTTGVSDAKAQLRMRSTTSRERPLATQNGSRPNQHAAGDQGSEFLSEHRQAARWYPHDARGHGAAEEDDDGEAEATRDSGPNVNETQRAGPVSYMR